MGLSVRRLGPARGRGPAVLTAAPPRGSELRRVVVVGAGPGIATLRSTEQPVHAAGAGVSVVASDPARVPDEWHYAGSIDRLGDILDREEVAEAVLCLEDGTWHLAEGVIRACVARGVRVTIAIPDRSPPPAALQRRLKRALDVIGSAVGLVVLSPILAAAAIAIRVRDGSPVLFRQYRAGESGAPFEILKFRTMDRDADARRDDLRKHSAVTGGASFKMDDDPRVTRLGRWLRKTSVDELPQLWNVLRGEMSLVGPRPHPYDDLGGYRSWHLRRLEVKPGITGLWQVELRNDPDFDRWVEKDLEYIGRWSIRLDAEILLRTIPALLRGGGR